MAGGFSTQQTAFIDTLSAHTGLNPGVVAAWVAAEEPVGASSGYHGTQDWLNVGITDSGPMGAGNAVWQNPQQAAVATANWIKGAWTDPGFGNAAPGIRAIAGTSSQSPQSQLAAIQKSGWASSGYPDLPSLYSTYGSYRPSGGGPPLPAQAPAQAPGPSGTVNQTTFDQQGYQQAQNRYVAGQFLSGQRSSPWNIGPKVNVGGVSGTGPNLFTPGLLSTKEPNPADFQTTQAYKVAQNTLQRIAGNTSLAVHPQATPGFKGYVNPLPGFTLGRTDMGVDANAAPGTPIRAIGDSRLTQVLPNWYSNQPLLLFQFLNGPNAGQYWYVAEQINPATTQIGTVFHAGDPVATYANSGTGIEIGYGSPTSNSRTLAGQQGNTGDASHNDAPAGVAFRQLLGQLGAH